MLPGAFAARYTGADRRPTISSRTAALARLFEPHLEAWGYKGDLLRGDYESGRGVAEARRVSYATFAHRPLDARTSCIAVIEVEPEPIEAEVSACRDLGAPVVFVCHEG